MTAGLSVTDGWSRGGNRSLGSLFAQLKLQMSFFFLLKMKASASTPERECGHANVSVMTVSFAKKNFKRLPQVFFFFNIVLRLC